jgi:oxaloacetate decarboxylase gamma subunit
MVELGLELVVFGMGTVFVFLTLLVFVTGLMSSLVLRFAPEAPIIPPRRPSGPEGATDPTILAAISAAVKRYRQDHGK